MTKREYIETFVWAFIAIILASTGVQYAEGFGRAIFCILTLALCVAAAYLLSCFIEKIEA